MGPGGVDSAVQTDKKPGNAARVRQDTTCAVNYVGSDILISNGNSGRHDPACLASSLKLWGSMGMQSPLTMQSKYPAAPELAITRWFNTPSNPTLADLRGEVVIIEAFQMLCPGCVSHGLPQAQRIHQLFGDDVTVLGVHCVFEHHDAMTPVSLEAFLFEYRIRFPVGVDAHEPGITMPITMGRYRLRGTPSLVVVDRAGRIRLNAFGQIDDLAVGAILARLIDEPRPEPETNCDPHIGCPVPTLDSNL